MTSKNHPPESGAVPVSTPDTKPAARPTLGMATSPARQRGKIGVPLTLACVALALLAIGIIPRIHAAAALTQQTSDAANMNVTVIHPGLAPSTQELLLPASVMPYADAAIYARTSGYLAHWYKDIGAPVKAGEVLATIEAPDLDAQLRQASADVDTAKAAFDYAKVTSDRWQTMLKSQSVSVQEAETRLTDQETKQAMLKAAIANQQRLRELVSFEQIRAPFDGIVTARNVDVGALITAGGTNGTASAPGELFHLEQVSTLRVFVDVPQSDATFITPETSVYLSTAQYPGRRFDAKVARTTGTINPTSRTLHVEIDVDNRDGMLMPGAYAQAHIALNNPHPAIDLPVSAIMQRPQGTIVAVVDAQNKTALKTVTIGRDDGTRLEITHGLNASDNVIDNPTDSITAGETVNVVPAATSAPSTSSAS